MEIPAELDSYLRETIDDSVGLPVSTHTLRRKLRASEDAHRRILRQCLLLDEKLRQKDQILDRARAEATMNAVALKKFVDENQKLAGECANLVAQCKKWERECTLYDNDREALMEFGNEADERAKDAEIRVHELEQTLQSLSEELKVCKQQYASRGNKMDASSAESTDGEEHMVDSVLTALTCEDEISCGRYFLEANKDQEPCQKLLKIWSSLKPSTQKVMLLAAKVSTLKNDKEHIRINLTRAEEEVELLFQENKILNEENRKLVKQLKRERNPDASASGEKQCSSGSSKRSKRKSSSPRSSCVSSAGGKVDFGQEIEQMSRQPLSPLRQNSVDVRMI
ncbi:hypothetical protein LINGRAHAP2_LOCUS16224 [Linum grandiflorum]